MTAASQQSGQGILLSLSFGQRCEERAIAQALHSVGRNNKEHTLSAVRDAQEQTSCQKCGGATINLISRADMQCQSNFINIQPLL